MKYTVLKLTKVKSLFLGILITCTPIATMNNESMLNEKTKISFFERAYKNTLEKMFTFFAHIFKKKKNLSDDFEVLLEDDTQLLTDQEILQLIHHKEK